MADEALKELIQRLEDSIKEISEKIDEADDKNLVHAQVSLRQDLKRMKKQIEKFKKALKK